MKREEIDNDLLSNLSNSDSCRPECWYEPLTRISDQLGACAAHVVAIDDTRTPMSFGGGGGECGPEAFEDYWEYFPIDARWPEILARELVQPDEFPLVVPDSTLLNDRIRSDSPVHCEFLPKFNCEQQLLSVLPVSQTMFRGRPRKFFAACALSRSKGKSFFDDSESRLFQHYAQQIRFQFQAEIYRAAFSQYEQMLDSVDMGFVCVNAKGIVQFMNRGAERIVSSGFGIKLDKLRLRVGSKQRQLDQAIEEAYKVYLGEPRSNAGSLTIKHSGSRKPYLVQAAPMSTGEELGLPSQPCVAVYISPPIDEIHPELVPRAMDFWGLTKAEATVAFLLVEGHSPKAISSIRGTTIGVVRSQLAAIYGKTQTNGQTELVNLISRSPIRCGLS